jgi:hypothetical protein
VSAEGIGIDIDLILPLESTHRCNFGDATGGEKSVADLPILNGAEFVRIPSSGWISLRITTFENIPKNLTEGEDWPEES